MFRNDKAADKNIVRAVQKRLMQAGSGANTPMKATVQNGIVTVSGVLRYESQRLPILKALRGIAGVSRIVDQLKVVPRKPL